MFSRPAWLLAALWAFYCALHAADYQVFERGPHSKTWQRQELDESGQIQTHQYVELADGLCYWDTSAGAWADSVPAFEAFQNRGYVAQRGQIQVILSPTLQAGGVEVLTPAGRFHGSSRRSCSGRKMPNSGRNWRNRN